MKKEYLIVFTIFLFILSYVLNFLAGSVVLTLPSPSSFLNPNYLSIYPLTAAEIGIRSVAYALTVLLITDGLIENYFQKAIAVFATGALSVAYAIQQMATGGSLTSFQWTLSFAYGGLLLLPTSAYYVLRGILKGVYSSLGGGTKETQDVDKHSEIKESGS